MPLGPWYPYLLTILLERCIVQRSALLVPAGTCTGGLTSQDGVFAYVYSMAMSCKLKTMLGCWMAYGARAAGLYNSIEEWIGGRAGH